MLAVTFVIVVAVLLHYCSCCNFNTLLLLLLIITDYVQKISIQNCSFYALVMLQYIQSSSEVDEPSQAYKGK